MSTFINKRKKQTNNQYSKVYSSKKEVKEDETNLIVLYSDITSLSLKLENCLSEHYKFNFSKEEILKMLKNGKCNFIEYGHESKNYMRLITDFYEKKHIDDTINSSKDFKFELLYGETIDLKPLYSNINKNNIEFKSVVPHIRSIEEMNRNILYSIITNKKIEFTEKQQKLYELCKVVYKDIELGDMYFLNCKLIQNIKAHIVNNEPKEIRNLLVSLLCPKSNDSLYNTIIDILKSGKWKDLKYPNKETCYYLDIQEVEHNNYIDEKFGNAKTSEVIAFTLAIHRYHCYLKSMDTYYGTIANKAVFENISDIENKKINDKCFIPEGLNSGYLFLTTLICNLNVQHVNIIRTKYKKEEDRESFKHMVMGFGVKNEKYITLDDGAIVNCDQFNYRLGLINQYIPSITPSDLEEIYDRLSDEYFKGPKLFSDIKKYFKKM